MWLKTTRLKSGPRTELQTRLLLSRQAEEVQRGGQLMSGVHWSSAAHGGKKVGKSHRQQTKPHERVKGDFECLPWTWPTRHFRIKSCLISSFTACVVLHSSFCILENSGSVSCSTLFRLSAVSDRAWI